MRLLMCEDWVYPWYADILSHRLRELGVDAQPFKTMRYFQTGSSRRWSFRQAGRRMQRRFRWGPAVTRLNRDLIRTVENQRPDTVFLYRGDLVLPATLRELRSRGILIAGYSNDDPFSAAYPPYVWRHLVRGLPFYHVYFAYRHKNLGELSAHGTEHVALLRSYYIREVHRPLPPSALVNSPYRCDVTFVGHWEDDGRDEHVGRLLDSPDIDFRLFGAEVQWCNSPIYSRICRTLGPVRQKFGDEYNLVLNSAKIALVFLSKLNNDTYTRRCFEIPAAGALMLAEYSDELNSLFREGVEAEYFRCSGEMIDKSRYYLKHEDQRRRIAAAGRQRVVADGHEALDRARAIVATLQECQRKSRMSARIHETSDHSDSRSMSQHGRAA